MNKKEIEELIKFVAKSGVSEVSLETKEVKITIKNNAAIVAQVAAPVMHAIPQVMPAAMPAAAAPARVEAPPQAADTGSNGKALHTIKSPMIGTFYRSSAPDKPNF